MNDAPTQIEFGDLWIVAVHESAHFVVGESLGYPSNAIATTSAGLTRYSRLIKDPIHSLAVDWAGLVAQAMLGATNERAPIPALRLTESTVEQWTRETLGMFSHCNRDHDLYRSTWRDMPEVIAGSKLAFVVLSGVADHLLAKAKELYFEALKREPINDGDAIRKFEVEQDQQCLSAVLALPANQQALAAYREKEAAILANAIPMPPDGFPAVWSSFAHVVANGDPSDWLHHEARRRGFQGQSVYEGIELLMQDWGTLDKETWIILARSFREWRNQHETNRSTAAA